MAVTPTKPELRDLFGGSDVMFERRRAPDFVTAVLADGTIDDAEAKDIAAARALLTPERKKTLDDAFAAKTKAPLPAPASGDAVQRAALKMIEDDPTLLFSLGSVAKNDPVLIRAALAKKPELLEKLSPAQAELVPEVLPAYLKRAPLALFSMSDAAQNDADYATIVVTADPLLIARFASAPRELVELALTKSDGAAWALLPPSFRNDAAFIRDALSLTQGKVFRFFSSAERADVALCKAAIALDKDNALYAETIDESVRRYAQRYLERHPETFGGMSLALRSDPSVASVAVYGWPDNVLRTEGAARKELALVKAALAAKPTLLRALPHEWRADPEVAAFALGAVRGKDARNETENRRQLLEDAPDSAFYGPDVLELGLGDLAPLRKGFIAELRTLQKEDPKAYAALVAKCKKHHVARIERFSSVAQLQRVLADREPVPGDTRPVVLVIGARSDHNGGFVDMDDYFDRLRDYRVVYVEAEDDPEATAFLDSFEPGVQFCQAYIAGHGTPDSIRLGSVWSETIEGNDDAFFAALARRLTPDAAIALLACSTAGPTSGENLAQRVARATGHRTFGAKEDTAHAKLDIEDGRLVGVRYEGAKGAVETFVAEP